MAKSKPQAVVWKEGRHYVAQSIQADVSSFGLTRREALANLDEALRLYFERDKFTVNPFKPPQLCCGWVIDYGRNSK